MRKLAISLSLSPEVMQKLQKISEVERRSISSLVDTILFKSLKEVDNNEAVK